MAVGRGLTESARTTYTQAWALPISAPFSPISRLPAGDPTQTVLSQRMGFCGWGWSPPHCPPRTRGQGCQQRNSQKPFLYFSFLPFNQVAEAEDEWVLEGKERHRGRDPPGNRLCTLLRLVRLEKQFNNKLYRIRNVQKCQGDCWLVSCLPRGGRVMPTSPVQRSWGWPGGSQILPQERSSPAHPAELCQGAGAWVCAQVPGPPQAPWLSGVSVSSLYVRPLKVFIQV